MISQQQYEAEKIALQARNLAPQEYEKAIRALAKKLKV